MDQGCQCLHSIQVCSRTPFCTMINFHPLYYVGIDKLFYPTLYLITLYSKIVNGATGDKNITVSSVTPDINQLLLGKPFYDRQVMICLIPNKLCILMTDRKILLWSEIFNFIVLFHLDKISQSDWKQNWHKPSVGHNVANWATLWNWIHIIICLKV